jgi:hypothetical protein
MRKPLPLLLAATVLGLTACGSSNPSTTTKKAAAPAVTQTQTQTHTQTTATDPAAKTKTASSKPAPKPKPKPSATADIVPAPKPVHIHIHPERKLKVRPLHLVAHVKGPSPITCLKQAGLLNPHSTSKGEAEALSAAVGQDVYVDGPYKNHAAAVSAAGSLNGVEIAEASGLYMVSATLPSHLNADVKAVAKCLKSTKGKGFLGF